MIADDDALDRKAIKRALRKSEFACAVREADSLQLAIDAFREEPFDCAVIDHNMPGVSGLDGIDALRALSPYMVVIMSTGQGDEMIASEAIKRGASDYIPKSRIAADLLRQTIERGLEKTALQRRLDQQNAELAAQKRQLESANQALQASNSELRDFAHLAAHDLREPIRTAASHASMLLDMHRDELGEEVKKRLGRICALTERMAALTSGLLDYSRLDAGENFELVDCRALIAEVTQDLAEFFAEHNAEISVADDLPPATGCKAQLRIVFQNLLVNGVKYNVSDTRRIVIGWREHRSDGAPSGVCFTVSDNGVGIAPEDQKRAFQIFKRLHHDDAFGEGTGLGLSFVKRVVEAHGERIWMESEVGRGTTFHITNIGESQSLA